MRYSRTGIIAVLAAAEVFILGAIVWTLGGRAHIARAGSIGPASTTPRTFAPLDAGQTPHVVVDDPDTQVTVIPSTDGKIHVADYSRAAGWMVHSPSIAPLQVERTSDGVSIVRPQTDGMNVMIFGWSDQRIEVAIPPASRLEIQRCSGAELSQLTGSVRVHSVDGHIAAANLSGDADLASDDGSIHVDGFRSQNLTVATSDGELELSNVDATTLNGSSDDGSISAQGLRTGGGRLHSDDGSISLAFVDAGNLTLHASTDDGSIAVNGSTTENDDSDSVSNQYHLGSGAGSLEASTQDGSIHVTTNGAN